MSANTKLYEKIDITNKTSPEALAACLVDFVKKAEKDSYAICINNKQEFVLAARKIAAGQTAVLFHDLNNRAIITMLQPALNKLAIADTAIYDLVHIAKIEAVRQGGFPVSEPITLENAIMKLDEYTAKLESSLKISVNDKPKDKPVSPGRLSLFGKKSYVESPNPNTEPSISVKPKLK